MIVPAPILCYQMTFTKQLILRLEIVVTLPCQPRPKLPPPISPVNVKPWNFDASPATSSPKFPLEDWDLPGQVTPLPIISV